MQNPFIALNQLRQQAQVQRQQIGCAYLSQLGVNGGANNQLVQQRAEILQDNVILISDSTFIAPQQNYPTAGLEVSTLQLFQAFKSCFFNSLFDPLLPTENLMEGFTRTDAEKTILAQFLHRLFLDINSIAPLFLQGNTYQTATFRQGRLNLLLYPFMFSENINIQNVATDKRLSNTIGYFVTKKLLLVLSATIRMSQEDVTRIVPTIPFANEILLNQTIEEIINKVNLDIASITSKKQFASNYAESSGTYIGIKVPNSLEYTKLRALGFSVLIKQQGAAFITTFFQTNSIFSLILPQDASLAVRLLFQNFGNLYRRYQMFFVRTTHLLETIFNSPPGQNGAARDPQQEQTFFAAVGNHMLYKLMYKKTRFTPFKFRPEQAVRQRDLLAQTNRLLIPTQPLPNVAQSVIDMDAQYQADNGDVHTILDGSNQFIDALTLKQQRQFVSDFLVNQAPRLQEQEIPV